MRYPIQCPHGLFWANHQSEGQLLLELHIKQPTKVVNGFCLFCKALQKLSVYKEKKEGQFVTPVIRIRTKSDREAIEKPLADQQKTLVGYFYSVNQQKKETFVFLIL